MKSSERTQQLLGNIARLRRLQQRLPNEHDLAAVRADLERELGETVSRRGAARFLDVSHTALDRWIEGGDMPLVFTPEGRQRVPVGALLELKDRVAAGRVEGHRQLHHLEPVMREDRERAERMRPYRYVSPDNDSIGHGKAELRGLAYHRAIAGRLNRKMVQEAVHRTLRWRGEGRLDRRYAEQWLDLLARPIPEIRQAITEDSQRGRDLRQNSPFAGVLTERERRRILRAAG